MSRRTVLVSSAASCLAAVSAASFGQSAPALAESDPQAQALGYVADATRADKARFPKYAAGQHCGGCQLFQGQPTAATAPCALFAGKQVPGAGWCSAFVARAA
jgi:High potential iron-sulfur protein